MKAAELIIPILPAIRGPGSRDLIDRIAGAIDSIHSNIAEGYGKGFCQDNVRYLKIAISSATEAESRLESAVRTGRLRHPRAREGIELLRRARALTVGFMHHVERRIRDNPQ